MRKRFNLTIFFLMTLVLISAIVLVRGGSAMNKDIILILKTDKENYAIGDIMDFTYTFVNNGLETTYVLPWGGHYITNWIAVYDNQGEKLQDLPLVMYEMKFVPSKEEFIRIEPKQSYSISIKGRLVKTTLSKFGSIKEKKYQGLFINFDNSAIYLKKPGVFTVKASYKGLEDWRKKGKELYGIDNIFVGNLESEGIKIIVR